MNIPPTKVLPGVLVHLCVYDWLCVCEKVKKFDEASVAIFVRHTLRMNNLFNELVAGTRHDFCCRPLCHTAI